MNKFNFLFLLPIVFAIFLSLCLFDNTFAQENQLTSPRHQWKQLPDPDVLTCKEGLILIQKNSGVPACVSPSTYLKLVDRDYGKFDSSQLMKRPAMMTNLMSGMVNDPQLMHHWHSMMMNDQKVMQQTMSNMVLQLKNNSEYMTNIMGPMTTNPELRKQMIEHMKNNDMMMKSLQENPRWMTSVHQPIISSNVDQEMGHGMNGQMGCSWCPEMEKHDIQFAPGFHHPKVMEEMMHHIWLNENMRNQMHNFMFENRYHMGLMTEQMMGPLLEFLMEDPELRVQMIGMMLEHQDFMNSIRHENQFSN
ncbi:MAG: hypothetical protein PVI88_01045 [Nitrosopumilaceae archaeon]|jgi:hypothetical protein